MLSSLRQSYASASVHKLKKITKVAYKPCLLSLLQDRYLLLAGNCSYIRYQSIHPSTLLLLNLFIAELSPERHWHGLRSQEVGGGGTIPNYTVTTRMFLH